MQWELAWELARETGLETGLAWASELPSVCASAWQLAELSSAEAYAIPWQWASLQVGEWEHAPAEFLSLWGLIRTIGHL